MDDTGSIESANLVEIERLNQRGGRTLSFVDLIEAGTVSADMAGELAACVEAGASVLTAARRGGAGKSTLLADMLACLPPGERIITTPDVDAVNAARVARGERRACHLAHEIGAGPWYAYLWGSAAARFLALGRRGARVASCLHADELDELYEVLGSQGADPADVRSIGIVAFMRSTERGRRVESVYVPGPKGHRVRWLRDEVEDAFFADGPSPASEDRARMFAGLFEELADRGVRDFAAVRRALAERMGAARD